jgi:hypothetical protein
MKTQVNISSFNCHFLCKECEILQDIKTGCRFTAQNFAPPSEIIASPQFSYSFLAGKSRPQCGVLSEV